MRSHSLNKPPVIIFDRSKDPLFSDMASLGIREAYHQPLLFNDPNSAVDEAMYVNCAMLVVCPPTVGGYDRDHLNALIGVTIDHDLSLGIIARTTILHYAEKQEPRLVSKKTLFMDSYAPHRIPEDIKEWLAQLSAARATNIVPVS
jgi:hypothetical protein